MSRARQQTRSAASADSRGRAAIALACAAVVLALLGYSVIAQRRSQLLARRVHALESELAQLRTAAANPRDAVSQTDVPDTVESGAGSAKEPTPSQPEGDARPQPPESPATDAADLLAELQQARQAFEREPDSAARTLLLRRLADLDAAYQQHSPDQPALTEAALDSAVALRDPEAALTWLERKLADAASLDAARLSPAVVLALKAGDAARCTAAFTLATQRTGNDPAILLCDAALQWNQTRRSEAYAALTTCAEALAETPRAGLDLALSIAPGDPRYPAARRLLAMLLHAGGRPAEAVKVWKEAVNAEPSDAIGFDRLGVALLDVLEDAAARAAFQSALALDPPAPDARYHLGVAETNLDHLEAALAAFDEAVRENSRPAESRLGRAVCFARLGRMADAEQELTRALALDAALMDVAAEVPAFAGILEGRE